MTAERKKNMTFSLPRRTLFPAQWVEKLVSKSDRYIIRIMNVPIDLFCLVFYQTQWLVSEWLIPGCSVIRSEKSRERPEQFIVKYRNFDWDGGDRGVTKKFYVWLVQERNFSFRRNSTVTRTAHIARD